MSPEDWTSSGVTLILTRPEGADILGPERSATMTFAEMTSFVPVNFWRERKFYRASNGTLKSPMVMMMILIEVIITRSNDSMGVRILDAKGSLIGDVELKGDILEWFPKILKLCSTFILRLGSGNHYGLMINSDRSIPLEFYSLRSLAHSGGFILGPERR